jgi:uncharacterized membrane protein YtjA (UPF0391 family)
VFNCAIICLVVALLAAVVSFGGLLDVDAAIAAQHIYFIAIGLFVVSAMLTILDLELSRDIRVRLARGSRGVRPGEPTGTHGGRGRCEPTMGGSHPDRSRPASEAQCRVVAA